MLPSAIRHFVVAFLIAALIFGIVGALGLNWFGKAVREKEKSSVTDNTQNKNDTEQSDEQGNGNGNPLLRGQSFSMLLVLNDYQPGVDYGYPEEYEGIVRPVLKQADSLVYLRFDRENAKLYTSVIPSETVITVDGVTMTVKEAYHYKDAAYLADRLSVLLGIRINYYCDATYDEFVSFVNGAEMGGVTLDLPKDIKITLRSGVSVTLKQGARYLDGEHALALLSSEGIADPQLRSEVRLAFVQTVLEKLTTLDNKMNPDRFYDAVLGKLKTNMTKENLSANTNMVFAYFDLTKENLTVPGVYDGEGNFIVDEEAAQAAFRVGAVLE